MKVAVIGAGLSGLATAYELAAAGKNEVVVFDKGGIGSGASGVAAGLLHPYAGAHSKKNTNADTALKATNRLIAISEAALGHPVHFSTGLLRLAVSDEQYGNFKECAETNSDVRWMDNCTTETAIEGLRPLPGIFIESGQIVDCQAYLKGLWLACEALNVIFEKRCIESLQELERFEHIVVAMGADSALFPELSHLRITKVKGHVLELNWPDSCAPLPFPVSSQAYLLMAPGRRQAIAGATFEHYFKDEAPDIEEACEAILPKIQAFFPPITRSFVAGCRAGIRASMPGHRPYSGRVSDRLWVISGMGSKGLLYHALYAGELSRQIASSGKGHGPLRQS